MSKIDPGKYKARIKKWGLAESNTKKTPQLFFTCDVVGFYQKGSGEEKCHDMNSAERTVFRPITENTIDYVIQDVRKLGWTGAELAELNPDHPNAHDFSNQPIDLICEHETYQGKQTERWSFAFSGGGELTLSMLDKKGIGALQAHFGGKLKAGAKSPAKKADVPATVVNNADGVEETL